MHSARRNPISWFSSYFVYVEAYWARCRAYLETDSLQFLTSIMCSLRSSLLHCGFSYTFTHQRAQTDRQTPPGDWWHMAETYQDINGPVCSGLRWWLDSWMNKMWDKTKCTHILELSVWESRSLWLWSHQIHSAYSCHYAWFQRFVGIFKSKKLQFTLYVRHQLI